MAQNLVETVEIATKEGTINVLRVAIVEDHQVLVDALKLYLQREADFEFQWSAGSIADAQKKVQATPPDVMLLDVNLPDGDGLEFIPFVKAVSPDIHIVVLTSLSDENTLMRAVDRGVSGFVSKSSPLHDLVSAVRRAAEGEIIMPAGMLVGLLKRVPRDQAAYYTDQKGWEPLTPREREVLSLLSVGKSGEEIAAELHIAPLTVRTHIRNLMAKLDVHSRLEAVAFAIKHGIVEGPG